MNNKFNPHLLLTMALSALVFSISACNKNSEPAKNEEASQKSDGNPPTWIASANLANPLAVNRPQEALYFSYYDLGLDPTAGSNLNIGVVIGSQAVASQHIDRDGNGEKDGIQVSVDLAASQNLTLEFVVDSAITDTSWPKLTQAEISYKEGGEWIPHPNAENKQAYEGGEFKNTNKLSPPEYYTDHSNWIRYEGPGIESDKVGYRIYLDWRNGFDIFGKSVAEPVLQNVGQDGYESYHHIQDWGMDILKVGQSLGSGGFGLWNGKNVELISDVEKHTATILDNGSIYSAFSIEYKGWKFNNSSIDLNAQFSMNAGSRMVHTLVKPSSPLPNFAIGVVKHEGSEFIQGSFDLPGDTWTYIGSWGQQSLNNDMLGMAVLFRNGELNKVIDDANSWAVSLSAESNELDYYFTAAWQGEHNAGIASKDEFVAYLQEEAEKLTLKPRVVLKTALTQSNLNFPVTAKSALTWSKKMADSELQRKTLNYKLNGRDPIRKRATKFEYDIVGLLPMSYHELGKETGNKKYSDVVQQVTASYINDDGSIETYKEENYNIDSVAPGRAVLRLYEDNPQEKYKIAASHLRKQLERHPRTSEGAFWHKKRYPWQLWLDGVYMGMPFLAEYSALFEEGASYSEVLKEFEITRKYLRDPETGLYYHAWDEKKEQIWADSETGLSRFFWGRGIGWLSMGLVDVLDYIPEDANEYRQPLLDMTNELAEALIAYQDKQTGTWWQIVDKPEETGNYREASASAMFTYFLAKALRQGYLPEKYKNPTIKAYEGLLKEFVLVHADGSISFTQNCLVAGLGYGRDGSYHYYMSEQVFANDPKSVAPFILAGIEISRLLN